MKDIACLKKVCISLFLLIIFYKGEINVYIGVT